MIPKSPIESGLPPKFHTRRPSQTYALEEALQSDLRFNAQDMPTGGGKTGFYVELAQILHPNGGRIAFVTATKGLQDQIQGEFQSIGMRDIRGKAAYSCDYKPDYTCEDGHQGKCPKKGTPHCPYTRAYNAARAARLVLTNYSAWIMQHKYGNGLGPFNMVVFDEAHAAPDWLGNALQIRLSVHEIEEMLELNFPLEKDLTNHVWKKWAAEVRPVAQNVMMEAWEHIQSSRDPKPSWVRTYQHLKNLTRKLGMLALIKAEDWVWDVNDEGYQFDPIRVGRYSESYLFLKIPKVVLVSATIRPKTMFILGVAARDFRFVEHPPVFDPQLAPIYWVPTQRMVYHQKDHSQWLLRIDQISMTRMMLNRNGIIHSHSYERAEEIAAGLNRLDIVKAKDRKEPVAKVVQRFKAMGATIPPVMLISPAAGTGYDFPHDECRWQIHAKMPFPDSRSKIMKARQEADREYGPYLMSQKLEQQAGRGDRADDDWCEDFIIDDQAEWAIPKYRYMLSKTFQARYRPVNAIPRPLFE